MAVREMAYLKHLDKWRSLGLMFILLILMSPWFAKRILGTPLPFPLEMALTYVAGIGLLVVLVVTWWRKRQLAQKLAALNYHACPQCLYDLRGTIVTPPGEPSDQPATVLCPECGTTVQITRNALLWRGWTQYQ